MTRDEAEAHERARARLRAMDPEDRFQTLVDAGIYTSDGELAPGYRDDSEPEPEQSLVDQIIETAASIRAQTAAPVAEFWFGTRAWSRFRIEAEAQCRYPDERSRFRDLNIVGLIHGIPIVLKPVLGPDDVVPMVRCPLCISRPGLCICVQGLVPAPMPRP